MNHRGIFQKRARATGCPGVAASSPFLLFGAGFGLLAPQPLQVRMIERLKDRKVASQQQASAKVALLRERCRAEAVIPPPSGDKSKAGINVTMRLGWLAQAAFYFFVRTNFAGFSFEACILRFASCF